jgi:hypothetical protein
MYEPLSFQPHPPSHGTDGVLSAGLRCKPGAELSGVFLPEAVGQLEDNNAAVLQRSKNQPLGTLIVIDPAKSDVSTGSPPEKCKINRALQNQGFKRWGDTMPHSRTLYLYLLKTPEIFC